MRRMENRPGDRLTQRLRVSPIANLSFALTDYFWGLNPFPFHLTNRLIHLGV